MKNVLNQDVYGKGIHGYCQLCLRENSAINKKIVGWKSIYICTILII